MNWKSLTDRELAILLEGERFKTVPMRHQLATLAMSTALDRTFAWNDIGTGKSLVGLYAHQIWRSKRILVVCPNCVLEGWADQIRQHTDWRAEVLTGAMPERLCRLLFSEANVFVANYESLQYLFGKRTKGPDGKTKWNLDYAAVSNVNFDGLVIDEAHHIGNHQSIQSRCCRALSKAARHAILLTGTPIKTIDDKGKPYLDPAIWGMYDVLNGGSTLGANRFRFLKAHFKQNYWGDWTVLPGGETKVLERIAPVTIRYSRAECFDLPERTYEDRQCDMTTEQADLTTQLVNGLEITLPEGSLKEQDDMHLANKLAQVAGGLLILDNGAVHRLAKNPKLDLLMETLEDVGKVVVFHSFVEEGRMICERLAKAKIKYEAMRGDVADRNGWRRFNDDPGVRVLVAHPASGGEGINLQGSCSTIIFYSNGATGAAVRAQAEGRIWRHGQAERCLYLDLVLRKSVDEARLERTRDRAEAAEKLLGFIEKYRNSL